MRELTAPCSARTADALSWACLDLGMGQAELVNDADDGIDRLEGR
ncbi:hypothetical protein [Endozoicomonas sp. G2_2]|jgi:hypothetical protein|nr:hypothetical protein [Endozoicomonas sp. G2_2]